MVVSGKWGIRLLFHHADDSMKNIFYFSHFFICNFLFQDYCIKDKTQQRWIIYAKKESLSVIIR